MTEIELKARVPDPDATERAIRAIARFSSETVKSDVYWKRPAASGETLDRPTRTAAAGAIVSFASALAAAIALALGAPKEAAIAVCLGGCVVVALLSLAVSFVRRKDGTTASEDFRAGGKDVRLRIRSESGVSTVTYKRKELQGDIEVNDEREFSIDDRAAFETLIGDLGFVPYVTKEKKTKTFAYASPMGTEVSIELSLVTGLGWFIELEILADDPDEAETARARETLFGTLDSCGIARSAIETRYYTEMLSSLTRTAP